MYSHFHLIIPAINVEMDQSRGREVSFICEQEEGEDKLGGVLGLRLDQERKTVL